MHLDPDRAPHHASPLSQGHGPGVRSTQPQPRFSGLQEHLLPWLPTLSWGQWPEVP